MNFPEVIHSETSKNSASLQLKISAALEAFKGHFDEAPIIPGVVQLQWVLYFCGLYLKVIPAEQIERIEALKFQQIIQPDSVVKLDLEIRNGKLVFSFLSQAGRHSSGKITLL